MHRESFLALVLPGGRRSVPRCGDTKECALNRRPPVFDGRNDCLLRLWTGGAAGASAACVATARGHVDLDRAAGGGLAGGFFAVFPPPGGPFRMPGFVPPRDYPLPPGFPQVAALRTIAGQAGIAAALDGAGALKICRSRAEIDAAMAADMLAAVLHTEGAEAISSDLAELDPLHAAGLRSIGRSGRGPRSSVTAYRFAARLMPTSAPGSWKRAAGVSRAAGSCASWSIRAI